MLNREAVRDVGREFITFVPDLVVMLRHVAADPRVPQSAKVEAAAALAYLVSPKNRLTNMVPVVGQLDDVAVVAFAFRRLAVGAGEHVLREHWRGSDRAFGVLMSASSALASPRGLLRRAKLAHSLATSAFDKVGGRARSGAAGPDGPGAVAAGDGVPKRRVVDGEVVQRPASSDVGRAEAGAAEPEPRGASGHRLRAR
jgi:uncharacterized membrane protein YkvA (DUF1232 family)